MNDFTKVRGGFVAMLVPVMPRIRKVVFNDLETIVVFENGSRRTVTAPDEYRYDPDTAIVYAVAEEVLGGKKELHRWLDEQLRKGLDVLSPSIRVGRLDSEGIRKAVWIARSVIRGKRFTRARRRAEAESPE